MFTAKAKRNYKAAIWTAVILLLCVLITVLFWPAAPAEPSETEMGTAPGRNPDSSVLQADPGILTSQNPSLWTGTHQDETGNNQGQAQTGNGEDFAEKNNISTERLSYYLVRRAGDRISVFFCSGGENGENMVQLETTEILYELLGPEDQKLFDEGIRVESQEELSILLQDFEG